VVEEVLDGPADAPVVIGRAQNDRVRPVDARLQLSVAGEVMRDVRVVESERLLLQVEHIHRAARGLKLLSHVANHHARHRIALEAADDGQDM